MSRELPGLLPADAELLVRDVLPGRAVASCVQRTGGQLSQVYQAGFADGTEPVIIKVYAPARTWKQAKEAHVYRLLHREGFGPVPRILHAGSTPPRLAGLGYTVMTWLPGQPLSELSDGLADDALLDIYRQMGTLLATLHRISQDAFGYLSTAIVDPRPTNTGYMTAQFVRKLTEFTGLGGDPVIHAGIQGYLAAHGQAFAACQHAALCHNDLHEGNILVQRQLGRWRVTGIVDVENALAAGPLIDLAKTDCYSIRGHAAKLDGLLAGYGSCGPRAAGRLAICRLYHALELWDWFASVGRTGPLDSIAADMRAMLTAG